MRKKLIATLLLLFTGFSNTVYAQTPTKQPNGLTSTPAATEAEKEQKLIDQINTLKEKVASKVAELKLVEKRGITGIVTQVSGNKITLADTQNASRSVDVDELTEFSSPGSKEAFGISDISKGTNLSIIGLYNKQSKRILARFVETVTLPTFVTGVVTETDRANFTLTVQPENQTPVLVDIENVTRTSEYTEEDDVVRAGFSKIAAGDRVHIMGYPNKDEKARITATRVLIFPELPKNPKILLPETSEEDTSPTPPTGRVSPTRRPSPTPEE